MGVHTGICFAAQASHSTRPGTPPPSAPSAGKDFSNQDLRRSNFTSASCKRTNFSNSQFQGAYFIKAVLYEANFEVGDPGFPARSPRPTGLLGYWASKEPA